MAKQLIDLLEGIENAADVEKVIKENLKNESCKLFIDDGKDNIYIPKSRLDSKIAELGTANRTITSLNATIEELKSKVGDEEAQTKIEELQKSLTDYESKLKTVQIENALDILAIENNAKDAKDLRAFVDMKKVSIADNGDVLGLKEQVETLVKEKSYLFNIKEDENSDKNSHSKNFQFFPPNPGKTANTDIFNSKTIHAGDFGKLLAEKDVKTESDNKIDSDYFFK